MKKMLFFALAAAGMLSACSNEDNLGGNGEQASTPKIQLGVSNVTTSVNTRGTGTVGDLENGTENVWAGQELFIYMLNQDKMTLGLYKDPGQTDVDAGTVVFKNEKFTAPVGTESGVAKTQSGDIKYYPVSGNYDFWGYHVDNAAQGDPYMIDAEGNEFTDEADAANAVKRAIKVHIDGSQDIMTGKAEPTQDEIAKLGNYSENFYSAYAARKDVQPNIKFEHNLTRFIFEVRAGSKGTCGQIADGDVADAVKVTGISVKSKTDGVLTIAYNKENKPESVLEFPGDFDDVASSLSIQQRNSDDHNATLAPLSPVTLTWNDAENTADIIKVGEALLVAPGETEYPFTVKLQQNAQTNEDGTTKNYDLEQNAIIRMLNNQPFEAGKSYKVTITVYGLERIVVTATLIPWKDGGSIDIDDDRDENTIYTPADQD